MIKINIDSIIDDESMSNMIKGNLLTHYINNYPFYKNLIKTKYDFYNIVAYTVVLILNEKSPNKLKISELQSSLPLLMLYSSIILANVHLLSKVYKEQSSSL